MEENKWKILEGPHAHLVLILLRDRPGSLRSEIYSAVPKASRPTVQKRVDELMAADLIRIEQSKTHKAGQLLFLTRKGLNVTNSIIHTGKALEDTLNEEEDDPQTDYGTPSQHGDKVNG